MTDRVPSSILPGETLLSGPYHLFNNSFIIEYLNPSPLRNASVLMHATFRMSHPEPRLGKQYAQTPPLHLHFDQTESFVVLQGRVGTTVGYESVDKIWDRENTRNPISIHPWTPHTFWPVSVEGDEEVEDAVLLVWAHPMKDSGDFMYPPMLDHWFFISLLGHVSDVHEGREKLDILWLMLTQHDSRSASVMFPTWNALGPLRWLIPYGLQAALATIARWQGKTPLLEKYIGHEEFQEWRLSLKQNRKAL